MRLFRLKHVQPLDIKPDSYLLSLRVQSLGVQKQQID